MGAEDSDALDAAVSTLIADLPSDVTEARQRQFDLGLAWVHHPEGRGGLGLEPALQAVVNRRLGEAGVSTMTAAMAVGVALAGPTLAVHGSDELSDRLLRRAFSGEDGWCQLFSEPGAGSDMAALGCRAVRDGDEWIIDGQKVWTTNAHLANRALLLARTDPDAPKHRGITFFAPDLTAPGVEVRPLRQMTGQAEFSEVFLTGVRVPDADRVGDLHDGWRVAMTTLGNERSSIGGRGTTPRRGSGAIAEAVRLWQLLPADRRHPATLDRLMTLWSRAEVLRLTNARASANRRGGTPGPEGSVSKLAFADLNQDVYELCIELLGPHGLVDADFEHRRVDHLGYVGPSGSARTYFLRSRANSIEGGTTEIQRNVIGERVLGLPAEPRLDKTVPWRESLG